MDIFLARLNKNYKTFSPSFQKVARYLYNNLKEALLLNSAQIAIQANVSEATLTRFIKYFGFSGFIEFKREIGKQVLDDLSRTKTLAESAAVFEGSDSIFRGVINDDMKNIQGLIDYISEDLFREAIDKLCSARSIYVLGLRSSYALAFYLAFILRNLLKSIKLIKPGVWDMPEQLLDASNEDVLVSFSFKRYTRETVSISKRMKKKGVFTIAVTNDPLSELGQLADMPMIVKTDVLSYTAPMCLINALTNAIILKQKEKALPALNRLEEEFKEFETYIINGEPFIK